MTRTDLLETVSAAVPSRGNRHVLVAVDGPDGSGKTTFADALAAVLRAAGRLVVRVSLDDFHHVAAIRYRRGRTSPEGFWLDSYDYDRFHADVLDPLGQSRYRDPLGQSRYRDPLGQSRYRDRAHDLATDEVLDPPWLTAAPGSVVVVDGLFLHRDELVAYWDHSLFLDVPFEVTARRMAVRDGSNPDPSHPSMQRYVGAQRIYYAACRPQQRATVLVDNSDLDAPRIVRGPGAT